MTQKPLSVAADQVAAAQMLMEPEFRVALAALTWNYGPWEKILSFHRLVNELVDLTSDLPPWENAVSYHMALEGKKPVSAQRCRAQLTSLLIDSTVDNTASAVGEVNFMVISNELRCHPERYTEPFGYSHLYVSKDEIRRDTFESRIVEESGQEACSRAPFDLTALVGMYRTVEAIHLPTRSVFKKQFSFRKKDLDKLQKWQFALPVGFQSKSGTYSLETTEGNPKAQFRVALNSEINAELLFSSADVAYFRGKKHFPQPPSMPDKDVSLIVSIERIRALLFNLALDLPSVTNIGSAPFDTTSEELQFVTALDRKLRGANGY
jgi:hypothetical protein